MSTVGLDPKFSLSHPEFWKHAPEADSVATDDHTLEGSSINPDPEKAARNALKNLALGFLDQLDGTPRLGGAGLRAHAFTVLSHRTPEDLSNFSATPMKKVAFEILKKSSADTPSEKFSVGTSHGRAPSAKTCSTREEEAVKGLAQRFHEHELHCLRGERVGLELLRKPLKEVHEVVGDSLGKAASWACGKTGTFCQDAAEAVKQGVHKTVLVVREAIPAPVRKYAVTSVQRMGEGIEYGVTQYANWQEELLGIPVEETKEKWRLRFGNLSQSLGFAADVTALCYGGAAVRSGAARITEIVEKAARATSFGNVVAATRGPSRAFTKALGSRKELAQLGADLEEMPRVVSHHEVGDASVFTKVGWGPSIKGESIVYEIFGGLDLKHSRLPRILAKNECSLEISREPGETLAYWVERLERAPTAAKVQVAADAVHDLGRGLGELGSVQRFPLSIAERVCDAGRLLHKHDTLSEMIQPPRRFRSRDVLEETIERYLKVEDFAGWAHPDPHLGNCLWDRRSRQLTLIDLEPLFEEIETAADFIPTVSPVSSWIWTYTTLQDTLFRARAQGFSDKILRSFERGIQAGFQGTLPEATWDYHRLSGQYSRAIRAVELIEEADSYAERAIARAILKDALKNFTK